MDLVIVLVEKFCFHRPDSCLMENSASMDLVVVPWKISVSMDLIVVLWRNLFFFCYHRLDCCLMDMYIFSIDLIVVLWLFPFPWTWLLPYGEFMLPRTWLLSYGRVSDPLDLVVVPWKSFSRFD